MTKVAGKTLTVIAWLTGMLIAAAAPAAWGQSTLDPTVTQVVGGNAHTCALTTAGAVLCWGYNADGELGNGTTTTNYLPVAVSGLSSGVVVITAGDYHACALTTAGAVKCWGFNGDGELGNGATANSSVPVAVSGLSSGVAAIAAGGSHTCALTTAGALRCWGSNNNGELGNNTTTNSTVPVAVSGMYGGVAAIAAGGSHTCALTTAGAVQCWGYNGYGQLGNGTTTNSKLPVAVSGLSSGVAAIAAGEDHTCAVTAGVVQCWGYNHDGELGDGTTTNRVTPVAVTVGRIAVTAIAAGAYHTCALTATGLVRCWGLNNNGQLGNNSVANSTVPVTVSGLTSGIAAIAAGEAHNCALTAAGGLRCWGWNQYDQLGNGSRSINGLVPVNVRGLSAGVAAIAMGGSRYDFHYHVCALTTSGAARCWGYNADGELGNGTRTDSAVPVGVSGLSSGVAAIASGWYHTCALTKTGLVLCWGSNFDGELGNGTTTASAVPVAVNGLPSGVTAIAAGASRSCALTTAGGVECWGVISSRDNHGDISYTTSSSPVAISGLSSGVAAIAPGGNFTCVLTTAGGVQCWGRNDQGELGNGTTTDSDVPVGVSGLSNSVAAIAAGEENACALTTGGAVWCWGSGLDGVLGNGSKVTSSVPVAVTGLSSGVAAIAAGVNHTCAQMTVGAGGGVKCWGWNEFGQLGDGTTTSLSTDSDVPVALVDTFGRPISDLAVAITAGGDNSCALMKTSGLLQCWGNNQSNQLLTPVDGGNNFATPMISGQSLAFAPGTPVSGQPLATVAPASTLTLSATATPDLGSVPITYDTWTAGTCTVSGSTLTITGAPGTFCGLRASRASDGVNIYGTTAAAPQQLRLLQIVNSGFVSLTPARILDTRSGHTTSDGLYAGGGAVTAHGELDMSVLGRGGVAASGVDAVVLNVTVTDPTNAGFVTVWPTGDTRPASSNLNFAPGDSVSNLVIVKLGTNGQLSLFNSAGSTDLIADVVGYFASGSDLTSFSPARLLDTRPGRTTGDGLFEGAGAVGAHAQLDLTIGGRGGVPSTGVGAVIVNVTATDPTAAGFITAWPTDSLRPTASTLNFAPSQTIPNLLISKLSSIGQVSLFNSAGTTDLIADVAGWFPSNGDLNPLDPARLLDTRAGRTTADGLDEGIGALAAHTSFDLLVSGRGGVPATGAGAVVLNVTVTGPAAAGFLVAWPAGASRPQTSNLNFSSAQTIANLVIAKVGADGKVSLFSNADTDAIVDVVGWFPSP